MIKIYRKQLLIVVTIIFCFAAILSSSCLFANNTVNTDNYRITNYDVDINITDENFYKVQESIFVDFLVPKHGIFRFITYRFSESKNIFPKIENINVLDYPFNVSKDSIESTSMKVLKIGFTNKKLTGKYVYKINFDYKLGKIPGSLQFIYYNIMGNMSTNIEKGRVRIQLPRAIDDSKIQFFQGTIGSKTAFTNFKYNSVDNTIVADVAKPIGPNEFLTVFIPVSNDYFHKAVILPSTYDAFLPSYLVTSSIILIIILLLWIFFGRDHNIISIIEFFPPEGLSPIALDKYLREIDLDIVTPDKLKKCSSLFYYLANKGYLNIYFKDKYNFILNKTGKNLSKEAAHIIYFYNSIFKEKDQVAKIDIKKNYYEIASNTISMLPECKIIDNKSKGFMFLGFILTCVSVIPVIIGLADKTLVGMLVSIVVYLVTLITLCISGNIFEKSISGIGRGKYSSFIIIIMTIICGSIILMLLTGIISLVLLYLLFCFSLLLSFFIKKRNINQGRLMGRLKGFRVFIEKAKKDELEKLIDESPMYFYDILPYAHIFGVTKIWLDKFKDIDVVQPNWYQGNSSTIFTYSWLCGDLINSINSTVDASIQSSISQFNFPREGSGGGFSDGGGFSGGGFGGGGGGSW